MRQKIGVPYPFAAVESVFYEKLVRVQHNASHDAAYVQLAAPVTFLLAAKQTQIAQPCVCEYYLARSVNSECHSFRKTKLNCVHHVIEAVVLGF